MPRYSNQKMKILYVMTYLQERTDENNPATTQDLMAYLESLGIEAERKSIYSDIETLSEFGMDIMKVRLGNATGWYLASRDFQLAELRLLVDIVQSTRSITEKKSNELISKLGKLASVHQARTLDRQVWVRGRVKSMNELVYYTVDSIHAAIAANRRIRFHYFHFDVTRQRQLRHGGAWYTVSPLELLCDNEYYYLIAFDSASDSVRHYRVDKMLDTQITDMSREPSALREKVNYGEYAASHFSMFAGQPTTVRLEFRNELASVVIDRFGSDVMLVPSREGYFSVTISEVISKPFFGWVCGFGADARITAPQSAVDAMQEHIASIHALYEGADRN